MKINSLSIIKSTHYEITSAAQNQKRKAVKKISRDRNDDEARKADKENKLNLIDL